MQLTYDPSAGPLCSAGRHIATRTIDAHHARSYSGQPALLLRAVDAHHLRRSLSRHAHYAHPRRHQPALFLRAPSPRTTPAPTQASRRLLRFFYAHHRRAPKSRRAPSTRTTPAPTQASRRFYYAVSTRTIDAHRNRESHHAGLFAHQLGTLSLTARADVPPSLHLAASPEIPHTPSYYKHGETIQNKAVRHPNTITQMLAPAPGAFNLLAQRH